MKRDKNLDKKEYKKQPPEKFVPTELGSAVFASVDGRPTDEEYLILDDNSRDDREDGAVNNRKEKR